jgi:High potential iron-sulfur protein
MKAKTFHSSRRRALKAAVSVAGAALLGQALEGAPAEQPRPKATLQKRSKEKVGYRDYPYEGRSCAKCVLYAGHGECVLVEGEVSPEGWCLQWTPATMGRLRRPPTA